MRLTIRKVGSAIVVEHQEDVNSKLGRIELQTEQLASIISVLQMAQGAKVLNITLDI